jgi:hypothetical protein
MFLMLINFVQYFGSGVVGLTPNSMADERTQSTFPWLNGALQNRQKVATVARMIQVRQDVVMDPKVSMSGLLASCTPS